MLAPNQGARVEITYGVPSIRNLGTTKINVGNSMVNPLLSAKIEVTKISRSSPRTRFEVLEKSTDIGLLAHFGKFSL